jgi:hypothetical protein
MNNSRDEWIRSIPAGCGRTRLDIHRVTAGIALLVMLGGVVLALWYGSAFQAQFIGIGQAYSHSGCNPPGRTLSRATECFRYAAVELNFVASNTPPAVIMSQAERSWRLRLGKYQMRIGIGPGGARGGYGRPSQFTEVAWFSLVWAWP